VEARDRFKNALEINPNYFRARVMLAKSYHEDRNFQRTLEELDTCLSAAPTFYVDQVKNLIGLVRNDSPVEERLTIFNQLLEEKPSSAQVSKQIALEAIQNGDCDFALSELKKSLMRLSELKVDILLPGHNRIVESLPPGYIRETLQQWEGYLG